eukprot:GFYU01004322.1.p1 GENE.GFYU01004322.1~~GFYU01004322.1.p1  ORF type:complete len:252 (-),score=36.04 GFYU01004322.1:418-1173(-)
MVRLVFIRHAKSEVNAKPGIIGGRSEKCRITKLGVRQVDALARRLQKHNQMPTRIFSSTLRRAKQTTDLLCSALGYPKEKVVHSDKLVELDQGHWEGESRKDIYTAEVKASIASDNLHFRAPGGESQLDVESRMTSFVYDHIISKVNADDVVFVVSHGVAIKCFLRGVMSSAPVMTRKILLDNVSMTELDYQVSIGWTLCRVNDHYHLEDVEEPPEAEINDPYDVPELQGISEGGAAPTDTSEGSTTGGER